MLDKKSVLETLDIAGKETILAAHQNLGKNNLVEHLTKAIKEGRFDAKEEKIEEEIENEEVSL